MADVKKTTFTRENWDEAARFVLSEYTRRKSGKIRKEKERIWSEVDRQIRMIPIPLKTTGDNWFPNTELPLQATALEVLQADARRLTFPRGAEWYLAHSNVSDDYIQRFHERREKFPFIAGDAVPMDMDQESADVLVKSTINHFHNLFNFRQSINFLDVEAFKFGTYAARVKSAMLPEFSSDLRGVQKKSQRGPATIPVSIKRLYLDDTPQAVMMEGVSIQPAHIREYWQRRDDLILAAKSSGEGWIKSQVGRIEPTNEPVHMLEFEGDLVIPRSRDHLFLPNTVLTVAVSEGGPFSVRFRENKDGFRSYVTGVYEQEDMDSPYGTSPLMKGQPLQEIATMMANRLAAVVALSAQPPIFYDPTDTAMQRQGGPNIEPNSKNPSDDPKNSIQVLDNWNISDISSALALILNQYEELTGVTAPRRGAQTKSHTTAFAVDVENTRGLVRTDDYVESKEKGPLTSILQREYKIIKKTLNATPIFVGTAGIEGFARIAKEDLPEVVEFEVIGSAGPATERERRQLQAEAINQAAQLSQISQAQGGPQLNFEEALKEILNVFPSPARFITSSSGTANAAPGIGGIQGPAAMVQNEST